MYHPSTTTRAARRRLVAALVAGVITVVAGSLNTASADAPDPEPQRVQVSGGAAGGRLSFR